MDPLITFILFIANILALALSLSVLILAYTQHPGDIRGRAVLEFLGALSFYNFAVILLLEASVLNAPSPIAKIVINLNISGFALCTIGAFSLIISLAGMMKQAFQVLARAGMVFFLLVQWPLWTDKFFSADTARQLMLDYAPAGFVSAVLGVIYIAMTLGAAWVYRRRIDPMVTLG